MMVSLLLILFQVATISTIPTFCIRWFVQDIYEKVLVLHLVESLVTV